MEELSRPPLRLAPIGTSLLSLRLTDVINKLSNVLYRFKYYYDKYFSGIANINPTDLIVAHYDGSDWEDISALTNTSSSNSFVQKIWFCGN